MNFATTVGKEIQDMILEAAGNLLMPKEKLTRFLTATSLKRRHLPRGTDSGIIIFGAPILTTRVELDHLPP